MYKRFYLNNQWLFTEDFNESVVACDTPDIPFKTVRIPHTVKETPFNYFDESTYQMLAGYRKEIDIPSEWKSKRLILTFEAVAHVAELYINGVKVLRHGNGYTAFKCDITDYVKFGERNVIALSCDSREDKMNVPPFGKVIDYMTYGGIYRDVYLDLVNEVHFDDLFLYSSFFDPGINLTTEIKYAGTPADLKVRQFIFLEDGEQELSITKTDLAESSIKIQGMVPESVKLWDIDDPNLYKIRTELFDGDTLVDEDTRKFGFRKSEFRADGYYLNDKKVKLRGLDRHQSYPYVGYAMPASLQEMDADVLKNELCLNAVRTSHYPDSHDFFNRCDEIGLLAFTELPGWQYIGDLDWQDQACENVREMVTEFRNHPSIILWGVRINESQDSDDFYKRTNEIAHSLDPTRPTGGVRNFKKSHLFEDVYTYNDFSHNGDTPGCEPKKKVTSDMSKAYLISEYNGHMYPTKTFDQEERRTEHALRHARVIDAVAGEEDIAGSFGWCMADYNTHRDFGSGDRICYHGVLDMFRNPKMAAYVYEAEGSKEPFLEISSTMDIGEHPECNRGETYIFTNGDEVRAYKDDILLKTYRTSDSKLKNLKHGPIMINDFIGDVLETDAGFSHKTAEDIKKVLNTSAMYGASRLPLKVLLTAAKLIVIKHISMDDAVALYTKYVGNWGEKAPMYKYVAYRDGKAVKTLVKSITTRVHLEADAYREELVIDKTYDVGAVRISARDEYGNILTFFNEPVTLSVSGPVELIGSNILSLKGGMAGTYLRTLDTARDGDRATLTIRNAQCESVTKEFTIKRNEINSL